MLNAGTKVRLLETNSIVSFFNKLGSMMKYAIAQFLLPHLRLALVQEKYVRVLLPNSPLP
jgi:hypothetical protein